MRESNKRKKIEGELDNNAARKWKGIEKNGEECVARDSLSLCGSEEGECNQTEKFSLTKI